MPKIYQLPQYYDIAFTYDRIIYAEAEFLRSCFLRHSRIEVTHILEPACGSGMFLLEFARMGYHTVGYDISEEMVEYAGEIIRRNGLETLAGAVTGDMRSIRFDHPFDAAATLISSLSYLRADEDLRAHFRIMGETIRPGGVYVVEIFFACTDLESEKLPYETWRVEQDDLTIDVSWKLEGYEVEKRTRNIRLSMDIRNDGERFAFEERHSLRLWYPEDFAGFIQEGGFRMEGAYTQQFQPVPAGTSLTGELGALYLALVKE